MHQYDRARAAVTVAAELLKRGWETYDYHPAVSDSMRDYYQAATWRGVATHPDYPGVVVGVAVTEYDAQRLSGNPQFTYGTEAGDRCTFCAGTGVYPDGLTYEEALSSPDQRHTALDAIAQGEPLVEFWGAPPVNRDHYFDDGLPRCRRCHGTGHGWRETKTVRFTWPTFQATPRGKFWHIARDGRLGTTGMGMAQCADYTSGARAAVGVVDAIERSAKTASAGSSPTTSTTSSSPTTSASPTTGSVALTILAETMVSAQTRFTISDDRDWTYIAFPHEPGPELRAALQAPPYGAQWSKRRTAWYIKRNVPHDDLVAALTTAAAQVRAQQRPADPVLGTVPAVVLAAVPVPANAPPPPTPAPALPDVVPAPAPTMLPTPAATPMVQPTVPVTLPDSPDEPPAPACAAPTAPARTTRGKKAAAAVVQLSLF